MKKTPLKTYTTLKAHKPMRRIGKVGRANLVANRIIKVTAEKYRLDFCEIGKLGISTQCLGNWPLQTAHRHKRAWYKGDPHLLSDFRQWVKACQNCHEQIEHDATLTEKIFTILRGNES